MSDGEKSWASERTRKQIMLEEAERVRSAREDARAERWVRGLFVAVAVGLSVGVSLLLVGL